MLGKGETCIRFLIPILYVSLVFDAEWIGFPKRPDVSIFLPADVSLNNLVMGWRV